ncbi:alpha/beta hydrolase [Specibacter cremeus]|uniref:alpha/beta hydrolase n=1 Tax=Specibacter cremeus TaxID=1629051 RepID=UPI000F77DE8F|nr:alpha/beta fold hydrolase [Specibacter cremeus]
MTTATPSTAAFRSAGHGDTARIGVAISHGFTSTPASMRAWAEHLAGLGYAVNLPLLAGHGTHWTDMARSTWQQWYRDAENAYLELAGSCDAVFVAGLSMGGTLALRVAEHHPVAGVALVNPALTFADPRARFAPVLKHLVRSMPAIADDIKAPGVSEGAYDRTPVASVHELAKLFKDTVAGLPRVTAPTIVFRSTVDAVVPESSLDVLTAAIGARDLSVVALSNSYHVATMDNDAPMIFERSVDFFREHAHVPQS